MKTIENILDGVNKFGDTETIFRLMLKDGDDYVSLDNKHVVLNIANSYGLVLSMPLTNQVGYTIELDFKSEELSKLTPDAYKLEFEVTMVDGDIAKFPTKDGLPFHITNNLKQTQGTIIPTITFDEVLSAVDDKVNEYVHTIQKGDKGDTGETGATGLVDTTADYTFTGSNTFNKKIIAPAGLQGNSDSSDKLQTARRIGGQPFDGTSDISLQVGGRNLILGTETDTTWAADSTLNWSFNVIATGLKPSQTYTFSAEVTLGNTDQKNTTVSLYDASYSGQWLDSTDNFKADGTRDHWTFTVPSTIGTPTASLLIYAGTSGSTAGKSATFHHVKLETGNITTDWTPAPEDVPSNDAQLVHKTGTETIAGDKTFTGNNNFSGSTTIQTGNYGLRVTSTGVQKTSDGGTTWVNI